MTRSVHSRTRVCDFWKFGDLRNVLGYARNRKQVSLIDDIGIEPYIGLQEAVS
jgi:hypothetical protein